MLRPRAKPKFRPRGIAPSVFLAKAAEFTRRGGSAVYMAGSSELPGGCMPKASLVSVVEDDQFFRESMKRLMRSLGYAVEVFSSAADFLASPHLVETVCLIADVQMPGMTGAELHRHLIASGFAIPTILVTAYHDDDARVRALNEGVVCYLRKPVDATDLLRCLRAALHSDEPPNETL
jgi:FixJ family two-component response regulator